MPPKLSSLLLLSFFFLFLFLSLHHHYHSPSTTHSQNSNTNTPLSLQHLFLSLSSTSNSSISSHLKTLTLFPHLAGTSPSASASDYLHHHLRLSGLQTLTSNFTPLLSFPLHSSLSLFPSNLSLSLSETADKESIFIPPYHAFSPSGAAVGPAVYANYGRERDYEELERFGVNVRGCVVVVRRGVGPRGAVVEKAAERGAAAVLMYGDETPEGGVERGMVLVGEPGDLLTPGWGAVAEEGTERLGLEDEEVRRRRPRIPSMPVVGETVREVVRRLGGPPVPEEWRKGVVKEWSGVGGRGGGVMLNFTYEV